MITNGINSEGTPYQVNYSNGSTDITFTPITAKWIVKIQTTEELMVHTFESEPEIYENDESEFISIEDDNKAIYFHKFELKYIEIEKPKKLND